MNLDAIAGRFGTPAYVYDLAAVRAAHADLRGMLPQPSTCYYSLKANPHPALVGELVALGCPAEVCSTGEIDTALGAGARPADLLLTGPGKTAELVGYALRSGVRRISVDSPTDLSRVGELAARHGVAVACLLRVNADDAVAGMGLTMTGTASQFGADSSWVTAHPELFRARGRARVTGLHLYMGTNLTDADTLLRQFDTAAMLAARLVPVIGEVTEVDLGGGFGTPYARAGDRPKWTELAGRLGELLDRRLPGWRRGEPAVSFESGRYLVGDCGTLLCRVTDVKTSKDEVFAVLDAGVNHLGGMVGLRRLPPIVPSVEPVRPDSVRPDFGPPDDLRVPTTVVGPLCTPLDTFVRRADLPLLAPRDLVRVPNVGAYGLTASLLAFLGHPAPVEVVVDGPTVRDVSRLSLTRTSERHPPVRPIPHPITEEV